MGARKCGKQHETGQQESATPSSGSAVPPPALNHGGGMLPQWAFSTRSLDPWDDSVYTWLMNTQLLNQARELSVEERIELVEAIWDSIAASNAAPPLTEAQKVELDRRLADHEANPDDVIPWEEVKADAIARR
jgi:putative addiction module component (TIGR02574 family)